MTRSLSNSGYHVVGFGGTMVNVTTYIDYFENQIAKYNLQISINEMQMQTLEKENSYFSMKINNLEYAFVSKLKR